MNKNTEDFIFTLDSFNTSGCTGWYVRKDGKPGVIIVDAGGLRQEVHARNDRPDVAAAGYADGRCGFDVAFARPLRSGETFALMSEDGEELFQTTIANSEYTTDPMNLRLIRMVEPFVEMDIAKMRSTLMAKDIFRQYHELFAQNLNLRGGDDLVRELTNILADIKTTQHLLCAAMLNQARAENPDFTLKIPELERGGIREFAVDLRGDITGDNWHEAEEEGRWAGPRRRSSLLLPSPGAGTWQIRLEITNLVKGGGLEDISIRVNEEPLAMAKSGISAPCLLVGSFAIADEEQPFLALEFDYAQEPSPPAPNPVDGKADKRCVSFMLKSIYFSKIN